MGSRADNMDPAGECGEVPRIDSVCIIGAGPSGLAAAKYLRAEHAFSRIDILEQSGSVGGIWNYVPCEASTPDDLTIPQTSADSSPAQPIWSFDEQGSPNVAPEERPAFLTPLYDQLETNIPRGLMKFLDVDWPCDAQLFPQHDLVLDYIKRYAKGVHDLIHFSTQVLDVRPLENGKWVVQSQKLAQEGRLPPHEDIYDAVIVANGHFNVPYIPAVPGIEAWHSTYPDSIVHSRYYRRPDSDLYAGKKVIVVGNSASGVDIGAQIQTTCKWPLLMSQKSESYFDNDKSASRKDMPPIAEFLPQQRSVRFDDGSIESDIDVILYCTGYFYSYPFLRSLTPAVVTSGERVLNTYQHIFYRPRPSLAFVMLNQKVIPFPVAEAQCAVIARVFSRRLTLPDNALMEAWENDVLQERQGREFHVLKFPLDADYINMLHEWSLSAVSEPSDHSRSPPFWDDEARWMRERFAAIKTAFKDLGDRRHQVRTLEEVGFDYDEDRRAQANKS